MRVRLPAMPRARTLASLSLLVISLAAAAPIGAQTGNRTGESPAARHRWLPEGSVYSPSLASISRPGFGLTVLGVEENGIPEAGDLRFGLKLGGRFGLFRLAPRPGEAGRVWQLDLGAGFYGHFDIDNSLDNLGWDGLYGLVLSSAPADRKGPAFRAGVQHWSSHVGDEYAERTGRRRIGYTREELMLGVSWPGQLRGRGWRTYVEGAYGYTTRAEGPAGQELQMPGRVQAGVEHEAPGSLGAGGRWGWYAAFDAGAYEERDWEPDLTLGTGLLIDAGDRRWRAGVLLYDGRTPIGEFFQADERYAVVGIWLDLEREAPPLR